MISLIKILTSLSLIFLISLNSQERVIKKETQTSYLHDEKRKLIAEGSEIVKLYNEKGKVIEESNKRFWEQVQKTIVYIRKYYYNDNNLLDSSVLFEGEKNVLKLAYFYDSTGLTSGAVEILPSGAESFKTQYFYNNEKKLIRENLFNPGGLLYTEKEYKYDRKNNLIEEKGKEQGSLKYSWVYKYDKKKFLIERKDFNGTDKLIRLHSYENNKEGRPLTETEISYGLNGNVVRVVKYSYEYF
jgi:hypothetical protein